MTTKESELTASLLSAQAEKWTCFHCSESFTDKDKAAEHFGTFLNHEPACQIDIAKFREMEVYVARCREEDSDTDRAMYAQRSAHSLALIREEEKGYAKGVQDAQLEAQADNARLIKFIQHVKACSPSSVSPKAIEEALAIESQSTALDECCASGELDHKWGAHGRKGEIQCEYCGIEKPRTALQEYRDKVIEECAKVNEEWANEIIPHYSYALINAAKAIRELKHD